MADIPKIILPHGGYRNLIVYKKSDVIYEGTVMFCRRFLPAHGNRTVDQMVQAARSCKQNIAEGSAASGTSKETEIKLTGVARATLDELMLTLCHQTRYMLDKMLARQEADHKKFGGVRERMHAARTAARAEEWDKCLYSRLDGAKTAEELAARAAEIRSAVTRAMASIKRRKGWE